MILAQEETSFFDNSTLDRWEIPFGDWIDQAVDWIDVNLAGLLKIIEWPFDVMISWLVQDFLAVISWVWVVLGMGLIAALVRNVKVGIFVTVALTTCGLLGNAYWIETARTIGFIAVAVTLCVAVGIPIGIMAGRLDGFWQATRPVLDAMQVVHSFVYMLPFIFFWGIGEVSATMVTMIFAVPPLIRLTNLGIRQVPDDVVEAARAHGAPEWRVLFDVQIPLARPAITTGINQTLLLAISMLGIAAIMGAGGLGRLLFRALSNQDVALAASAGLAFFLVAVVLDRMSQKEDSDGGNLFHRIRGAWAHRRDPEELLSEEGAITTYKPVDRYEPITAKETSTMLLTAVGGIVAAVAVFLPWSIDAGWISAYGVRVDENLAGQSFDGLAASGGSFFGLVVLVLGVLTVLAVVASYLRPGRVLRWLTADGAVIFGVGAAISAAAFMLSKPSPLAIDPHLGFGVYLAVIGGVVASIGAISWVMIAKHSPLHPLRADITWGRLIGVGLAFLFIVVGAFASWTEDGRFDVIITSEIQEEIDRLTQLARDNPADAGAISAELSALMASAQVDDVIVVDGVSEDGAQLGIWTMLLGLVAAGVTLPAIGLFGRSEQTLWVWSSITAAIGAGIFLIAFNWISVFVRHTDPNFISGIGSFITMTAGAMIVASTMSVLKEFHRSKVYDDEPMPDRDAITAERAEEALEELV